MAFPIVVPWLTLKGEDTWWLIPPIRKHLSAAGRYRPLILWIRRSRGSMIEHAWWTWPLLHTFIPMNEWIIILFVHMLGVNNNNNINNKHGKWTKAVYYFCTTILPFCSPAPVLLHRCRPLCFQTGRSQSPCDNPVAPSSHLLQTLGYHSTHAISVY